MSSFRRSKHKHDIDLSKSYMGLGESQCQNACFNPHQPLKCRQLASLIWLLFELRLCCVVQASLELLRSNNSFLLASGNEGAPVSPWLTLLRFKLKTLWTQHRIFHKPPQKYLKHKFTLPTKVLYLVIWMVKEHCYTSCWWSSYNSFLVKKLNRKFLHIITDLERLMWKKSITSTWLIVNPVRI